ncbi:unnamed protein product [Ambrosiozyma monospora]|uniref:Unnamed protein product n=1 Tax=Ambrosiozyma monospora TaxID=43982 RepID=A0ACB5U826_AMBMO|nr:unnamed protein product [Ambrosiozyma monospora]
MTANYKLLSFRLFSKKLQGSITKGAVQQQQPQTDDLQKQQNQLAKKLQNVVHTRCFTLSEVINEIQEIENQSYYGDPSDENASHFGLIVIEDLHDLFNLENFKSFNSASSLVTVLFRKLRALTQIFGLSVVLLERQRRYSFNSTVIQKYMQMLYDYEFKLEEVDWQLKDVKGTAICNFDNSDETGVRQIHLGLDIFE